MKVLTDYLTTHLHLHTVCKVDWSVSVKERTVNYVRRILYLHRALNKVTQSANQHMHTFNFLFIKSVHVLVCRLRK